FSQYKMKTPAETRAMIRVIRICPKCGAKIFSDAPRGLCTACVLETALGIFPDALAAADDLSAGAPGTPRSGEGGSAKADNSGNKDEPSRDNAKAASGVTEAVSAAAMLGELGDY